MNTCKTCKHWTRPRDNSWREEQMCRPLDPDTYEPMQRGFEVRICRHPAQTKFEAPVERNGFGVTDGSEYMAVLATAEDFGCVRHEAADGVKVDGIPDDGEGGIAAYMAGNAGVKGRSE